MNSLRLRRRLFQSTSSSSLYRVRATKQKRKKQKNEYKKIIEFISLGAAALKYRNVVTVKPSITAAGPTMCEYSCHMWWQIWLFAPFHMTGCGSAGVNASCADKKAFRQPFPSHNELWVSFSFFLSFFFFFSFDYMKTSLAIKTHLEPAYETDSGRFSAVGCGASSKQWSRPVGTATTHQPPTFTDPLSTKLDHPPACPPPLPQPREKKKK